ncbi:hypothetical protein KP509_24G009500 [Ceratopteris richardii]|uniref:Glycosyl transferase family 1 domain-containing protein n=1 Tax=Ceratopteris richardii TaxID=49495 RepID=A0A8T2RV74_CERRI|nr:hypothetical protein KP509_24G009500 [Ceratopteris richardii]
MSLCMERPGATASIYNNFQKESGRSFLEVPSDFAAASSSLSSSSRNSGHPFKRYTVSSNGIHGTNENKSRYSRRQDWVRLVLKSKELDTKDAKPSNNDNRYTNFTRAWIYILFFIVAICYFATETVLQGSTGSLLQETASIASEALAVKHFHERAGKALSKSEILEYEVKFVPSKLNEHFLKQKVALDHLRNAPRSPIRRPRLAMVFFELGPTPELLYLLTMWKALAVLGYELHVFSLSDGPMHHEWEQNGAFVYIPKVDSIQYGLGIDWLMYECILLSSLDARSILESFCLDPFQQVKVVWILHERMQLDQHMYSVPTSEADALSGYKKAFERADVVLLSDYALAMMYGRFDRGNFYVLPGSPIPEFEARSFMSMHSRKEIRGLLNLSTHDIAIAVVGSPFSYRSAWRGYAIVMQAILPLDEFVQSKGLQLQIMTWSAASSRALKILASQSGFTNKSMHHFGRIDELNNLLWAADIIVYGSLREEQALPSVLVKALAFGHPIVVPNITVVRENMQDGRYSHVFEAGDNNALVRALKEALLESEVMNHGHGMRSKSVHGGLPIANIISEFVNFLEVFIDFPSDVHIPFPISLISEQLENNWPWQLLEAHTYSARKPPERNIVRSPIPERQRKSPLKIGHETGVTHYDDILDAADWDQFRLLKLAEEMEENEDEQIKERNGQIHGRWEEVYRSVRKAENMKHELHEREDGELERTGQPICIYEPYIGAGTWPLLGKKSILYRGINLISQQRRPDSDDIEAPLRLPLLNDSYYSDVLCEFGAFFAIANRVDRIHKNSWIGFQSWRAAGRNVSLSTKAELALVDAVKGHNGDKVYFWATTDLYSSKGSLQHDFWTICDSINNGNCRSMFLKAFKDMYALPSNWDLLPPMPNDGASWSALHSWAMPTSSFLEFVMFSRMFVSSLDSLTSGQAHGTCNLSVSPREAKHCYCRILELLVNIWMYHSGRRMIILDPYDGTMHEQHHLPSRHNLMWLNFFSYETLKGMDEDLAGEVDDSFNTSKQWLWPRTGEVFCQQIYDRERRQWYNRKLEKKKRDKERVKRIRGRQRQQPLAKG